MKTQTIRQYYYWFSTKTSGRGLIRWSGLYSSKAQAQADICRTKAEKRWVGPLRTLTIRKDAP